MKKPREEEPLLSDEELSEDPQALYVGEDGNLHPLNEEDEFDWEAYREGLGGSLTKRRTREAAKKAKSTVKKPHVAAPARGESRQTTRKVSGRSSRSTGKTLHRRDLP